MATRSISRRRGKFRDRRVRDGVLNSPLHLTVFFRALLFRRSLQIRQKHLCRRLRFQRGPCGDFSCAQRCASFSSLHLAVAGDFCIPCCHAGRCLRGAALCSALRVGGCALRHNGQALAALVSLQTLIHFLLPRWLGGGLAHQCAQISRFPSDAVLESAVSQAQNCCSGSQCRVRMPDANVVPKRPMSLRSSKTGGNVCPIRSAPDYTTFRKHQGSTYPNKSYIAALAERDANRPNHELCAVRTLLFSMLLPQPLRARPMYYGLHLLCWPWSWDASSQFRVYHAAGSLSPAS